jgi:hypothetical protein
MTSNVKSDKPQKRLQQYALKEWGSVDTSANRQALKENDFGWLENYIQVGNANLQGLTGPSGILASTSGGDTIYELFDMNLNGSDKIVGICSNGAGYMFDTGSNAISKFAANATFASSGEAFAQWQNTLALFIGSSGGYQSWNGTTLVNLSTAFSVTASVTGGNLMTVTASPAGFIISSGMTLSTGGVVLSNGTGNGGNGTTNSANGTYNLTAGVNVGSQSITLTPSAPAVGSSIATYAGRVWIANGRTVLFSAPGSYSDFTTASAGGSFILTDSSLYGTITAMIAANNYLWIGGTDSVNVISDVRVPASTTTTLFTDTVISNQVGIPYQSGVTSYLRSLMFLNQTGPYALAGAVPEKLGPNLDGLLPLIDFTKTISCGSAQINNQNVAAWAVQYKDPTLLSTRLLMLCFFSGKWFFASQNTAANLTYIVQAVKAGVPLFFGTDGTNFFQLFSSTTTAPTQTVITAMWSQGDPTLDKQVMKLGVESVFPNGVASVNMSVDTPFSVNNYLLTNQVTATWTTFSGLISSWNTVGGQLSIWVTGTNTPIYTDTNMTVGTTIINPVNSSGNKGTGFGKYYGHTVTTNAVNVVINGLLSEFAYRTRW